MKSVNLRASQKSVLRGNIGPTSNVVGWLVPVFIIAITVAAFFPVLDNGFVNWDDDKNILQNSHYRGLGWTNLYWMFTTLHMGHYQPLSWMTLGLDYLLWGMDPFGYHLTNLLLHIANAVLFYFVGLRLLRLTFSTFTAATDLSLRLAAGFAALVFSIHPLRVESVAWVTERRDVLSGLFFLWTILCYLRAVEAGGTRSGQQWMSVAFIVFCFSLLSKASGTTLPLVLLLLDIYPLGRLTGGPRRWFAPEHRRVLWEKVPFLLFALWAGVVAGIAQYQSGAITPLEKHGILARIAQALFGLVIYIWKTILPLGLSPLYDLVGRVDLLGWTFLLSGALVFIISITLFVFRRYWPAGLASWIYYVLVLAPVLGIVQSGPQIAADRYTYLSCLGWAILAGAGLSYCWKLSVGNRKKMRPIMIFASSLAVIALVALASLTWRQTKVWHDSESLWRYVLKFSGQSAFAHNNLGSALDEQERLEEAIDQFQQALLIDPSFARAHYNLGMLLMRQGKLAEAKGHFREALRQIKKNRGMMAQHNSSD
jgi:protein O-mannosyl-transferase